MSNSKRQRFNRWSSRVLSLGVLAMSGCASEPNINDKQAAEDSRDPSGGVDSDVVSPDSGPDVGGEGLEFVEIPAGSFDMGSPPDELGRREDEAIHRVTITRSFLLGRTEVTQAQWKLLSGGVNPSNYENDTGPVENVDWYSAIGYLNALSVREGLQACYELVGCSDLVNGWKDGEHTGCSDASFVGLSCAGYRLPTEAEWEYAARAGTTTATYLGNLSGNVDVCGTDESLDSIAWWCGNSGGGTQPVKQKAPNAWGLYDMLGNMWEWVHDWYDDYAVPASDPIGPVTGDYRVFRGGSWISNARHVRAAYRYWDSPGLRVGDLGFRPARSIP